MKQEFVTLPREVVKQALEALYSSTPNGRDWTEHGLARQALRAALEQPQVEQPAMTPIAQRKLDDLVASGYTISGYSVYHERKHQHGFVTGAGLVGWWKPEGVEYPQPQVEQEPVAWIENLGGGISYSAHHEAARKLPEGVIFDLYTHQQPKREPLTNEQISRLWSDAHNDTTDRMAFQVLARAIESAHNIK